jgi:hypothetical protein
MPIPEAFRKGPIKPSAVSLTCFGLIIALLDELKYSQVIKKEAVERVLTNARTELNRASSGGDFYDAMSLLRAMQEELNKSDW